MSLMSVQALTPDDVQPQEPPRPLLPVGAEWTVDDLDRVPDDGLQYELFDGMLVVSPAPTRRHQLVIPRLHLVLAPGCPDDVQIYFAPLDFRPDRSTSVQPDLLIASRSDRGDRLTEPLLLAVEVLSPSTRKKDQLLKFVKYQEAGVGSYWMIDPAEPGIVAYDLVDGAYAEVGRASGEEQLSLSRPYPVTLVPARLTED